MPTTRGKIDTRSLGLELGLGLTRFLTGKEHLHYGLWENGLEVCAANLREAQEAYNRRLFNLLPDGELSILDIGGGSGETAKELTRLGHRVEIVVPSENLAARCKENTDNRVPVHLLPFERFVSDRRFDVCLFSESFQYIEIGRALDNAVGHLSGDGEILIADCFRTDAFGQDMTELGLVGGGHALAGFRQAMSVRPLEILFEEDVTDLVAPSIDLEQQFYNMIGQATHNIDRDLGVAYPKLRWLLSKGFRRLLGRRRIARLERRIHGTERNSDAFRKYNRYLFLRIRPAPAP